MIMNNKHLILLTGLASLLIVLIPTIYKVVKDYQTKLISVVEKEITEAALNCWNEDKCTDDEITLDDLYQLKYLDKQINPINKKVYDGSSKIIKKDKKIELKLK